MAEHHDILWAIHADTKISSTAKCAATALLLKFYNPGTGRCDPSFTTIGKVIGRSRRSAIKAIDELKAGDDPWLVVESTKGGSQANTNSFRFRSRTGVTSYTGAENDTGAVIVATGVESCTGPVSDAAHELSIELSKNYEGERRTRAKRLPNDFGLDPGTHEWALSRLGSADAVQASMFRFANHHRAIGSRFVDWTAKARLWIDEDARKPPDRGSSVVAAADRLLNKVRSSDSGPTLTDGQWEPIIARFAKTGIWTKHVDICGNAPPAADCGAPKHLLAKYGLSEEAA